MIAMPAIDQPSGKSPNKSQPKSIAQMSCDYVAITVRDAILREA